MKDRKEMLRNIAGMLERAEYETLVFVEALLQETEQRKRTKGTGRTDCHASVRTGSQ